MKTRISTFAAVVGLLIAVSATDLFAAGRGNGGYGKRNGTCVSQQTRQQTRSVGATATRPEGSQRRDGTFLTTGVTANGSTTRPGNGNGLQDGSRLTTTPAVTPAPAQ